MSTDRHNYNIINLLYGQTLRRNADHIAFKTFNSMLKRENSPQMINKIKNIIIEADQKKIPLENYFCKPEEKTNKDFIKFMIDKSIKTSTKDSQHIISKKFLIIGLIKNITPHFQNLKSTIENIIVRNYNSRFFFLTNNNTDNTVEILKKWMEENPKVDGILYNDTQINILNNDGTIGNRVEILAKLRNENFRLALQEHGKDFDNLIILDTDLESVLDYQNIASCFDLDQEWDIIAGNNVFAYTNYHYDRFALRLLGEHDNINLLYPNFKKYYGHSHRWIDNLLVFKSFFQVKSAFGGICLINKSAFEHEKLWDENTPLNCCEHIRMCQKFNKIYVNPKLSTSIGINNPLKLRQINNSSLIDTLSHVPYVFVPRDAGFFSVFNFFIGCVSNGCKVYPYFNQNIIEKLDGKIKHFCYLDNTIDNSWFNYFEPISYFSSDYIHQKGLFKNFHLTRGEFSKNEFKFPKASRELYQRNDFYQWRCSIHHIFTNYIKIKSSISEKSLLISKHFSDKMIGVHFRHPSHSCEQGTIYLRNYFSEIDKIIKVNNDVSIFLATDTDFGIAAFTQQYPNKIIYNTDCSRTSMDNFLSWVYDSQKYKADGVGFLNGTGYELQHQNSKEKNYSTSLGIDVLLDVTLLSKCNWFIHTVSNLSLAVSYWNPECSMILLDK